MKLSKGEHYFVVRPKSVRKEYKFQTNLFGCHLDFFTASSIFSPRAVDLGSLTMMRYMQLKKNGKILDLGCGYGPIGLYAAKVCPTCNVTMVDINERAVSCAKKNIRANYVENAKAKQSFAFSSLKGEMFDVILLNPPISAGLEQCYKLVEQSFEHIIEGGSLQVVAKNRKGGARISEKMEEIFGNVDVLGRKAGYWVYISNR